MKGDILRGMFGTRGQRDCRKHPIGKSRGPLQDLHPAHRAARHAKQTFNAQTVQQAGLRAHHVADGDDRKINRPRILGCGIQAGRTRRAHATAQHIGANDKEAVRIKRFSRPHHAGPPTGLAGHRIDIGDMLVARQSVAYQNRIAAILVQRAIGLIGYLPRRQSKAAIEHQGLMGGKMRNGA